VKGGGLRVGPSARGGDGGVEGRDGGRGEALARGGHRRRHGGLAGIGLGAKCKNARSETGKKLTASQRVAAQKKSWRGRQVCWCGCSVILYLHHFLFIFFSLFFFSLQTTIARKRCC
jgi:hypothetical protein